MKNTKKLLSLILTLVMIIGVVAPLSAYAIGNNNNNTIGTIAKDDYQKTKPEGKTKVTVHKLQADNYKVPEEGFGHNGGKLEKEQLEGLGTNVKELDGVTFTYYKLKDAAQLELFKKTPKQYDTNEKVEAVADVTKVGTITTANGQGAEVDLEEGYYWFVESGKPTTVSSSIAVPFGISIPVMNQTEIGEGDDLIPAGTVYLNKVHVYPKNVTGDEVIPKKTVGNEVNLNETHNVGDVQTWFLQANIPGNIKDYEKFVMSDVFFKGLTYKGNVKVYMGYDGAQDAQKVELEKGVDYNLVEPAADTKFTTVEPNPLDATTVLTAPAGQEFSVTLTEAGLKKLADNYQTVKQNAGEGKQVKIYATVDTVINEDAKMGTPIKNTYDLKIKIKGQDEKSKRPNDTPEVETGGKKFVKVSETEVTKKLAGAVFALYDGDKQIVWTQALIDANKDAIDNGKFCKDENGTVFATGTPEIGKPIYLQSDVNGLFEIKGLEYSKWEKTELDGNKTEITHNYKLKEVKFPEGYAGNKDTEIPFTVNKTSYKDNAEGYPENTHDAQGNMLVKNKDLTIPPTGGIGTVIFAVAGIALMGGAFIAIKKRSAEE